LAILDFMTEFAPEMEALRRRIHANPELGYQEFETARLVADKLAEFGVDEVVTGIGGTGIVGIIRAGSSERAIALRADMDALPMQEESSLAYRSTTAGRMHACGHDGHTAMLLGAARELARTRNFDGTVYVIFQPAEEGLAGAAAMIRDGLFERFPVEAVYGMHNWPGMAVGRFTVKPGTMMAAADRFDIVLRGAGSHGALPHHGIDPIMVAAQIITASQTIASRFSDPTESVVVSFTSIHGGTTYNVIPETVQLRGTIRTLSAAMREKTEALFRRIVTGIADSFGATAEIDYAIGYPPTVNEAQATELARRVAAEIVGPENVLPMERATMGAEDFSFMLEKRPGCYILVGNGSDPKHGHPLHNPHYDFNDDVLPIGASYWVRLAERALPAGAAAPA
jgi:hippurate hydrolase